MLTELNQKISTVPGNMAFHKTSKQALNFIEDDESLSEAKDENLEKLRKTFNIGLD